jgi:hypothetical protein
LSRKILNFIDLADRTWEKIFDFLIMDPIEAFVRGMLPPIEDHPPLEPLPDDIWGNTPSNRRD